MMKMNVDNYPNYDDPEVRRFIICSMKKYGNVSIVYKLTPCVLVTLI